MNNKQKAWLALTIIILSALACQVPFATPATAAPTITNTPTQTSTPLPVRPVEPGAPNPNEPIFIRGNIHYTSPFFVNSLSEPFVMLEDEAGFVKRDREFIFALQGQNIGPVEKKEDNTLVYSLSLPSVPQGTFVDVANNGKKNVGVQVFAIAYWSNTWGGPFLEKRDGTGWSTAYTSTITDPENENEITGGILIVWSPDDQQAFPTGFGSDGLLFTEDDPTATIPPGYNLVDLNKKPFHVFKQAEPTIDLNEGEGAVKDFSKLDYSDAFDAMFKKISVEYPFTKDKNINWDSLYNDYSPRVAEAGTDTEFYKVIHNFSQEFPDGHVGGAFDARVFLQEQGGSLGMVLSELSDKRVIISKILANQPAALAGIKEGTEILTWNGEPIDDAIAKVKPYFGYGSTEFTKRLAQVTFLTRMPEGTEVYLKLKNPDKSEKEVTLRAVIEYDSLTYSLYGTRPDSMALPVEGHVIEEANTAYIRVDTFSDDDNLLARLWERHVKALIDNEIPAVILDLRRNGGGNLGLAMSFASYFFDKEITLYQRLYFNENSEKFEVEGLPTRLTPAPLYYGGKIAILISPECVSACEGFAYALTQNKRATVVGHYPSAGAFGEVGRGQYRLPANIKLQFPTGRPETMDGKVVIEGTGVIPDVIVPVTSASVLTEEDVVLQSAITSLSQ